MVEDDALAVHAQLEVRETAAPGHLGGGLDEPGEVVGEIPYQTSQEREADILYPVLCRQAVQVSDRVVPGDAALGAALHAPPNAAHDILWLEAHERIGNGPLGTDRALQQEGAFRRMGQSIVQLRRGEPEVQFFDVHSAVAGGHDDQGTSMTIYNHY